MMADLIRADQPTETIVLSSRPQAMETDLSRVIVTISGSSSTASVHHRDFPEIHADGSSPQEAATLLLHQLHRALDSALIDWRRDRVNQAIADVRTFIDQES
jgi:hypothetical protein